MKRNRQFMYFLCFFCKKKRYNKEAKFGEAEKEGEKSMKTFLCVVRRVLAVLLALIFVLLGLPA